MPGLFPHLAEGIWVTQFLSAHPIPQNKLIGQRGWEYCSTGGKEDASSTQGKSLGILHHPQNNCSADEEHQCWRGCAENKLLLSEDQRCFPKTVYLFFFTEEKFRSCISSSFFCHKSGKLFKYQHSPNGEFPDFPTKPIFFYSWPDITLCPHELLHCPEPLFFTGPAKACA